MSFDRKLVTSIYNILMSRRYIPQSKSSPFKWDGSHLGTLKSDQIEEIDTIKIGRLLKVCTITIKDKTVTCLVKSIMSLLPAIFDELKPIFSLQKIGTHTFRYNGKLMIAYKPFFFRDKVYAETTLDTTPDHLVDKIEDQVRLNLAFREIFGITDTYERSLILRYKNPGNSSEIPTVISYLEPGSVAGLMDGFTSVLPQTIVNRWFSNDDQAKTLEKAVADLICLNREFPESSLAYYRPLVEEVIVRIDAGLITYLDLFFDRLGLYLPY